MRRTASLTILLIALTFGGFAAFLARSWLQSHSERAATKEEATIVVANKPLVFGTPLSADDVRAVPWPADSKPEGSFANVQELLKDGRRVVLSPFVHDEPIVGTKIGAPNQSASLSTVIEPGKRAVTVAVDDVRGVAGFIFPGDFVDVVLTRATNDNAQSFSEEILQHVKVLAIDQMSGDRQERPTVAKAVTLELTPEQALKILLATNIGKLSLILRQSAEVAMAPEMRMTEHDLYGGEPQPPAPPPAPAAVVLAPRPPPDPATRKVTVVRSMKSEEYEVPRDSY